MYFTQDDYRNIEEWFNARSVKDTQLPVALLPLAGNEMIPIIQEDKNRIIRFNAFLKEFLHKNLPDFINVTVLSESRCMPLEEAIQLIPVEQRRLGHIITFKTDKGNWVLYQFIGTSVNQWTSLNCWNSVLDENLKELVYYPDDEDVTDETIDGKSVIKFKDKKCDPSVFSGLGRKILRKNLVGGLCVEDGAFPKNILNQDMVTEGNTIYIIQYDFDLDGQFLVMPQNCTLLFMGGSINNGQLLLDKTLIEGVTNISDIGTAKVNGTFREGQLMNFTNDSGLLELRWWSGETWKTICSK